MGADEPANGQGAKEGAQQFAQNQPYAAAITPDGRADCETGQRGWLERNAGGLDAKYQRQPQPAHARRAGPDLQGQAARARGPDVHRRPRDERLPADGPLRVGAGDPMRARQATQAQEQRRHRAARAGDPAPADLPRLHQVDPVQAAVRDQGRLRVLQQPQEGLAGAHRRRRGRQGHEGRAASTRAATPRMVTMTVGKAGRPIHDDARAKIRPRIFLEGNFFVDIEPGTPGAAGDRRRRHDPDQPDRRARCSSTSC